LRSGRVTAGAYTLTQSVTIVLFAPAVPSPR
jgi:hypothetical protein